MSTEAAHPRSIPWSGLSLVAGLVFLAALWLGPFSTESHTAFSAHMVLHLGLMLVAAPLLALPLARSFPAQARFREALRWYSLAGAFELLVILGWHIPLLHDTAGHSPLLFATEQLSFLAAGIALWACIFSARTAGSAIAAALIAAFTFSHMTMFGLLLALVPRLIYDPNLCQGWNGLDGLADQHLGGAFMAAGGLFYLIAAVALFARVLRPRETN